MSFLSSEVAGDNMASIEDYIPAMLDDHPLRPQGRECCPGMLDFLKYSYRVAWKNWNERIFRIVCILLIILGIMQCVLVVSNGTIFSLPGDGDRSWEYGWDGLPQSHQRLNHWPLEFGNSSGCLSSDARIYPDPVYSAIESGCVGVKVNLWLHNNDILVGNSLSALETGNTLNRRYLSPLLRSLEHRNSADNPSRDGGGSLRGVLKDPSQTFILFLEFRTAFSPLWQHVISELSVLKELGYLTHMSGSQLVQRPVTVIATGQVPGDLASADSYESGVFFDASLDELVLETRSGFFRHTSLLDSQSPSEDHGTVQQHNDERVRFARRGLPRGSTPADRTESAYYCASAHFKESVGYPRHGRLSQQQIELIREQVRTAHNLGLKVRYSGIPGHRRVQMLVWQTLVREGADLIEVGGFT